MEKRYTYSIWNDFENLDGTVMASDYLEALRKIIRIHEHFMDYSEVSLYDETLHDLGARITITRQGVDDILMSEENYND